MGSRKGSAGRPGWNKDRHYKDIFNEEKAAAISKKMSIAKKGKKLKNHRSKATDEEKLFNKIHQLLLSALGGKRKSDHYKNYHPTPEVIERIRQATIKHWQNPTPARIAWKEAHPPGDARWIVK